MDRLWFDRRMGAPHRSVWRSDVIRLEVGRQRAAEESIGCLLTSQGNGLTPVGCSRVPWLLLPAVDPGRVPLFCSS